VLEIPDVVSAAAVGVPSMAAGEAIHVFLTARPGSGLSRQTVVLHCSRLLAEHMVPKKVAIIGAMPLNSNGKVVKLKLCRMPGE